MSNFKPACVDYIMSEFNFDACCMLHVIIKYLKEILSFFLWDDVRHDNSVYRALFV